MTRRSSWMAGDLPDRPRSSGRPRSVRSHAAILDATLHMLAEQGIRGSSIEAIAARAGVGKMTIYRRWPSKEALILEALRTFFTEPALANSGNVRDDLTTTLREAIQRSRSQPLQ